MPEDRVAAVRRSSSVRGKAADPEGWLAGMRGMHAAVAAVAAGA